MVMQDKPNQGIRNDFFELALERHQAIKPSYEQDEYSQIN